MASRFTPNKTDGAAAPVPYIEYDDDGAIAYIAGTVVLTKGTAQAMTLADPATSINGARLLITSHTAAAHTVTNTTGFNSTSTSGDVATFGGAIGDCMEIVAVDGIWQVVSLRNVTLG